MSCEPVNVERDLSLANDVLAQVIAAFGDEYRGLPPAARVGCLRQRLAAAERTLRQNGFIFDDRSEQWSLRPEAIRGIGR